MERLTTGRRHIRAGSVHVMELIGKQPRPFDDAGPFAFDGDGPTGAAMLDSLLDPDRQPPSSHRREPSRGARVAKIAGLAIASFVLCASSTIGSMITHQRRDDAAAEARPAMDISGQLALLPDLLNHAVPKAGMTGKPPVAAAPARAPQQARATGTIANPGPGPGRSSSTPAATPSAPPAPDTRDTRDTLDTLSKTELVERFFSLAPDAPDRAFRLLDGPLLGTDLDRFVRSWSNVHDLQVLDVHEQGDDVLAVVRLRLPDGTYLRVQQLLDVANTIPRRITGAAILSAQRS